MAQLAVWLRSVRRAVACGILLSFVGTYPTAMGAGGPYTFDMPRQFSQAYKNWRNSLPYAIGLGDWLTKLSGVVTPMKDVMIGGDRLKSGTVCVPHDCGDNMAGILFTSQGDRIMAVVQMVGQNGSPTTVVIERMSNDEYACIRRFIADYTLAVC